MDFREYQKKAMDTAIYHSINEGNSRIIYPALKLAGEAGEVSEKIGKLFRDKNGIIDDEFLLDIEKELGDVLWYIAALCQALGLNMETVAGINLLKLSDRKNRGVLKGSGDNR